MRRLLSIDPGMETGLVVLGWDPDDTAKILGRAQITGGLAGLMERIEPYLDSADDITVESFSPRPGARSWKLAELEPIRIEGALAVYEPDRITWRRPEQRKLVGTLKQTGHFLEDAGYWSTPKVIGRPDANDANSAMMHALGWLRDKAHRPTIDMLIEYGDKMSEELV